MIRHVCLLVLWQDEKSGNCENKEEPADQEPHQLYSVYELQREDQTESRPQIPNAKPEPRYPAPFVRGAMSGR